MKREKTARRKLVGFGEIGPYWQEKIIDALLERLGLVIVHDETTHDRRLEERRK